MIIIGLTGGIGSGKSTVGAMLKELGAAFIDADKVGHRLLKEDLAVKAAIVEVFGKKVLDSSGEIDRRRLASVVFSDCAVLKKLNSITHPAISHAVSQEIEELRKQRYSIVVVEAALLVEAGWTNQTDTIWLTEAPSDVIFKRLVGKMGYSESEARSRIACQTTNDHRRHYASAVIDTNTSLKELRSRVTELWAGLKPSVSDNPARRE